MLSVLVAEDNEDLCNLVVDELKRNGYNVKFAHDGDDAIDLYVSNHFDLIITDIMMPKVDGLQFISYVRGINTEIPILIMSAKASQVDIYDGFNAGTDDYMVKPIDIDELLMRVNALLRRAKITNERKLVIGGAVLDYDNFSVSIDGEVTTLPQKEFQILFKMLSFPNKIFTRNQLMDEFWSMDTNSDDMTVYTHIHRLRDRYQNCPYFEIVTLRNLGYKAVVK